MIPRISPGKTWEGFGGAIFASTVASLVFVHCLARKMPEMNWLKHALVLGVLLSVGAVVGDLIESIFKREAGVKDSGRFFPGIGGMLDCWTACCLMRHHVFVFAAYFDLPMKNVVLLGSTGSIGASTVKVVEDLPDRFRLLGLAAGDNVDLLLEQTRKHRP